MAPPPSTATSHLPLMGLVIRVFTFIFLLVALIVLATNSLTVVLGFGIDATIKFNSFYAYRYMLSAIVIGVAYTLLQTGKAVYHVSMGKPITHDGSTLFDFFGDKVISYLLATGAAAGFGFTVEANRGAGNGSDLQGFLHKANAAASLLLIAFLFSAVSSVLSAFALPKIEFSSTRVPAGTMTS